MKVFLVGGKSGSGKNEVARLIEEYYTYKLKKCAITEFSKYLKLFAKEMTEWDGISQNKPREFLQSTGKLIRNIDEHYFTRRMIQDLDVYAHMVDVLIICDVRMPLEFTEIKDNWPDVTSMIIVNQFAPSKLSLKQQSDITETALETFDDVDYIIANDDLKELKEKLFKILEGLN